MQPKRAGVDYTGPRARVAPSAENADVNLSFSTEVHMKKLSIGTPALPSTLSTADYQEARCRQESIRNHEYVIDILARII